MKEAFRFIDSERVNFPVKVMTVVFGVSRQAYYAWVKRPPSARATQDQDLRRLVKEVHARNRGVCGSPRIHAELRMDHGIRISKKRVQVPGVRAADDLLMRNFTADRPDQAWVADITYLGTWEGWLFLAVVQDLFSRRIVGWAMDDHMRSELVEDALKMAAHRRNPKAGFIHHSDQGSQYVSLAFGQLTTANGIARSMGKVGSAYDNAAAETFFATLKRELIK